MAYRGVMIYPNIQTIENAPLEREKYQLTVISPIIPEAAWGTHT